MHGSMKLIIGLLLMIAGIYAYLSGWFDGFFATQLKMLFWLVIGNIPGLIALIGLIMFLLGVSDIKG